MQSVGSSIKQALASGTVAGLAVAATAALTGKRETGSYAAPLNATSHIFWGDAAEKNSDASLKYTLTGFLLNHASSIFWASFYERWFGKSRAAGQEDRSIARPLIGAAVVTVGAYITDYYLVPKRFTPGFEKRLSGKSLLAIYGALALGMAALDLSARRQPH